MKRKIITPSFRLPYTPTQAFTLLDAAIQTEVAARGIQFVHSPEMTKHTTDIAKWLTNENKTTFGLFICGSTGNGKTTTLKALKSLVDYLYADEPRDEILRNRDFYIYNAKEIVQFAKAYHNPTSANEMKAERYQQVRRCFALGIDDFGIEARETMNYGEIITSVMDVLNERYELHLFTVITSNLDPREIAAHYDARIADRFREMMCIINFGNDKSFRMQHNTK